MHLQRAVVVGLLALHGTARAEILEPADTRESALLYEATPLRSDELGLSWRAEALAAALASTGNPDLPPAGGVASVSGEIAITGAGDCDAFTAGGQLASRSDEQRLSAQQWASVCPLGGDGFIRIDHRFEWDTTPRLLAAPRLRTGAQRRESFALDFFGSERPLRGELSLLEPRDWIQGGELRLELQFAWSEARGWDELRAFMDVVLFTWRHLQSDGSTFSLAVFAPRLDVLENMSSHDDAGVGTLAVDIGRIENVKLGPVYVGGRLGGRLAGMSIGRDERYRLVMAAVGEASVYVERPLVRDVTLRLAGDRRSWPTYNGGLAVDDRATLSLSARRGRLRALLELAAAKTHLLDARARKDVANGGLTAEASYDLGKHFVVAARSEAGKSSYAKHARFDDPKWASETQLVLATRFDERYRR